MKHERLAALLFLAGCAAAPARPAPLVPPAIDESRLVDLTWAFDEQTIYWPTSQPFRLERVAWGADEEGRWYAASDLCASEHGGTHLDAPIHFAEGRRSTAAIPLEQLVGPARVIDVAEACARERDYRVTAEDVEGHERAHGSIPRGAVVLVRTGWGRRWPDAERYLGSAERGEGVELHFPGLSAEAARVLVERGVDLVGIDTASLDHGPSADFAAHRVLAEADVPGLENVAQLELLPATGATLLALPMKIAGGTGGPVRIVALLP
jgi:kynurenine formamidase